MRALSARRLLQHRVYLPWVPIPAGRTVELPGRGTTWVTDSPGPTAQAPVLVLLHALGCTGLLTWFPAIPALARRREFGSTSPWAVGQAVAALGRHHSRPWLGRIDVPTAVVVTARDRAIPPSRQRMLARAIPGATTQEIDAGHAACTLQTETFVPALVEAVTTVHARRRDVARRGSP